MDKKKNALPSQSRRTSGCKFSATRTGISKRKSAFPNPKDNSLKRGKKSNINNPDRKAK